MNIKFKLHINIEIVGINGLFLLKSLNASYLFCSLMFNMHDKTNDLGFVYSKVSDQPGCQPSLIRVLAVHSVSSQWPWLSSCG